MITLNAGAVVGEGAEIPIDVSIPEIGALNVKL
jgi:hypothetical protein